MTTPSCRTLVALLSFMSCACGTSVPTAPTAIAPAPVTAVVQPVPAPPPSPRSFPPPTGPSRTFVFERGMTDRVQAYTQHSRIVLYDNGAFELQYPGGRYAGAYTQDSASLVFDWEGWSSAGPWGATGVLHGATLTIAYNLIMQHTDFEDAVYVER